MEEGRCKVVSEKQLGFGEWGKHSGKMNYL